VSDTATSSPATSLVDDKDDLDIAHHFRAASNLPHVRPIQKSIKINAQNLADVAATSEPSSERK
jgi:hypothetical protein